MLIPIQDVPRIKNNFPNITMVDLGKGPHYVQEDHPHTIGYTQWFFIRFKENLMGKEYPPATPHGEIKEIFEDVFFVTGSVVMAPGFSDQS